MGAKKRSVCANSWRCMACAKNSAERAEGNIVLVDYRNNGRQTTDHPPHPQARN